MQSRRGNVKKKRKRRIWVAVLLICLAAAGCFLYGMRGPKEPEEVSVPVEAGERERLTDGTISMINGNEMTYVDEETGEEQTILIPVGTTVTTKLGTQTTFSRLAAGNDIRILWETEDDNEQIVGIWIIDKTNERQKMDENIQKGGMPDGKEPAGERPNGDRPDPPYDQNEGNQQELPAWK